jgi:hypothetical protein
MIQREDVKNATIASPEELETLCVCAEAVAYGDVINALFRGIRSLAQEEQKTGVIDAVSVGTFTQALLLASERILKYFCSLTDKDPKGTLIVVNAIKSLNETVREWKGAKELFIRLKPELIRTGTMIQTIAERINQKGEEK